MGSWNLKVGWVLLQNKTKQLLLNGNESKAISLCIPLSRISLLVTEHVRF
jgi:hypothetical protein